MVVGRQVGTGLPRGRGNAVQMEGETLHVYLGPCLRADPGEAKKLVSEQTAWDDNGVCFS